MNNSNHYKGGNKNSSPTRYGNHKPGATAPSRDPGTGPAAPVSVAADADAARAAVAISSIEGSTMPMAAINGTLPAAATPLACADVLAEPSGKQILADTTRPAGAALPKS